MSGSLKVQRVCVFGAGAAGLIAIRHIKDDPMLEGIVFEQTNSIGGVWKYTDKTGNDEYGLPIHSTAYKGLRTNLPKEIMGYLDHPFPESKSSYIFHDEVQRYLEKFALDYNLPEFIQFNTRVIRVDHVSDTNFSGNDKMTWKVKTENLQTKANSEHEFDAVLICNGHYTTPLTPEIENLENFQGEIWHTRNYRTPDVFTGKRVAVFGAGPSAVDISLEVSKFASKIIFSCRNANPGYNLPDSYIIHSPLTSAKSRSFITATGEEVECDALLLCSGYVYEFPFLSSSCGINVEKGKYISPLYRHLINANYPTMAFIGIPFAVCPFPFFDCQVRFCLKVFKDELKLPTIENMLDHIKKEEALRRQACKSFNHSHKFGDLQWSYTKQLAQEAGFLHLWRPVIRKVYENAGHRRGEDPANYKNDLVKLLDNENYEYIESALIKKHAE